MKSTFSEPGIDIEDRGVSLAYLRRHGLIGGEDPISIRILTGGVSNRTVLVVDRQRSFVLKQALAKLRVAVDWYSDPLRVHIEALGLRWLEKLAPPGVITPLLFEDREQHVIAMAAVPEPHHNWKTLLMTDGPDSSHIEQFARNLAGIHRRSSEHSDVLASVFENRSFFESLRLEPYYRFSAQQVPESKQFFDALLEDTLSTRVAVVHGDYSPKNILIHEGKLVLLDHEVIHFGDPAFDVGFSLTHLLSKAHHFAARRTRFIEAAHQYVDQYLHSLEQCEWKSSAEPRAVRHTLGCLLARVAGRSPLEYLTAEERQTQGRMVLELMRHPSLCLSDFISEFSERIRCQQ